MNFTVTARSSFGSNRCRCRFVTFRLFPPLRSLGGTLPNSSNGAQTRLLLDFSKPSATSYTVTFCTSLRFVCLVRMWSARQSPIRARVYEPPPSRVLRNMSSRASLVCTASVITVSPLLWKSPRHYVPSPFLSLLAPSSPSYPWVRLHQYE